MSDLHQQFDKLTELTTKLLNEVARLRADVVKLHGRIEPFPDEVPDAHPVEHRRKYRNFVDVFDGISSARQSILGCEHHLNAIRGVMEGISSDAISREEMKPWLKSR